MSQFQTAVHTSNLFLTAAAQNLLCLKLAGEAGAPVDNAFNTWLLGASVPALVGVCGRFGWRQGLRECARGPAPPAPAAFSTPR
jgi:hypothetical protein